MRNAWVLGVATTAAVLVASMGVLAGEASHSREQLPAGPIRERHELMKTIGKHAKTIGELMKQGQVKPVVVEAQAIHREAQKIPGLFPPGSTHEKSRAKPEIWSHWDEFKSDAGALVRTSSALADTAAAEGDVKAASRKMFESCKSCHDSFRKPEKKK